MNHTINWCLNNWHNIGVRIHHWIKYFWIHKYVFETRKLENVRPKTSSIISQFLAFCSNIATSQHPSTIFTFWLVIVTCLFVPLQVIQSLVDYLPFRSVNVPNKNCEWPKVFVLKFYECDYFEAIYTRSFIAFAISYDATFKGFVW